MVRGSKIASINTLSGYKGILFNFMLFGIVYFFDIFLNAVNKSNENYEIPIYLLVFFTALLPFENMANQYILFTEFQKMKDNQKRIWQNFSKTYFFGLLLLMLIIWRSYFKIEFLILPICYKIYESFGVNYSILSWPSKIPVYLVGSIIFFGEMKLIGYTLIPRGKKENFVKALWFKMIILLSVSFFTTGLLTIFKPYFGGINQNNILINLPLLSIIFVFFYIPLRWVEIISDVIDCSNRWQLWLFWLTSFVGMVMMFK